MKTSYPIVLIPEKTGFTVYIPDFDINTQGDNLKDAAEMARDAIGIMGIDMEDDGKIIPTASNVCDVKHTDNETVVLVDIDFAEYRRKSKTKSV